MKEIYGNLWTYPADAYVITTNGTLKKNGACVMGRGVALQAKQRFSKADELVGYYIHKYGNNVHFHFMLDKKVETRKHWNIITYPVKHNWWEKADLTLIEKSAIQLMYGLDLRPWMEKVIVPRPGCGNGQLKWKEVKPILEKYFDDRIVIVERNH
jgi:hypothetical protein